MHAVYVRGDENFLETDSGDGHTALCIDIISLNYTPTNG